MSFWWRCQPPRQTWPLGLWRFCDRVPALLPAGTSSLAQLFSEPARARPGLLTSRCVSAEEAEEEGGFPTNTETQQPPALHRGATGSLAPIPT